ncbi:MAG: site-specific integrase [Desulfovibrio sp.]|nr:site-specific integrase [Desulfovibrio sp.]
MPTLRRDRGNGWWARAIVDGRQVACRMFPPGRKGGPEWRAAKEWEEKTAEEHKRDAPPTPTALERLLGWGEAYLAHAERTMKRQTKTEKETVMREFFAFCREEGIQRLEAVTKPKVYAFLSQLADSKSPNRANVYRKNLLSAWNWGIGYVEGFPSSPWVIESIAPFPVEAGERYVPPEEDVIKVLKKANGQDLVMLLTYYFTGGRRSELFRLSWERDVKLDAGRIRLTDYKGKNGKKRVRWYTMHPELIKAFAWWWDARPCKVDNVFMQVHCATHMGQPFTQRRHLMANLCKKAEVKPFGFHGLRHKSAAITFEAGGIAAAQLLMGHERATTTDRYVKSAGLYSDQSVILDALGGSGIGSAIAELLEKGMPLEGSAQEAFCTQGHVHNIIQ